MLLPVYHITCEGCGREFDWVPNAISEQPPNYHSKTCQKHKSARLRNQFPKKCPHPYKKTYSTHQLAQKACLALDDLYLKPYRCRCGAYHIGHVRMYIKDWVERP